MPFSRSSKLCFVWFQTLLRAVIGSSRFRLGARCVVFNNRGRGGHTLKTPRTYCASKTDDLAAVIDHIKAKNSSASLMAMGVSLGILTTVDILILQMLRLYCYESGQCQQFLACSLVLYFHMYHYWHLLYHLLS